MPVSFISLLNGCKYEEAKTLYRQGEVLKAELDYALVLAFSHHDADLLQWLLEAGADPNAPESAGPLGQLPLMSAAADGNEAQIRLLLGYGARADAVVGEQHAARAGQTAMHALFRYAPRQAIPLGELLVEHGANWETRDRAGRTPLDCFDATNEGSRVWPEDPTAFKARVLGYLEAKLQRTRMEQELPQALQSQRPRF